LITYTIAQAKRWGKADKIMVSTDSPVIAKIAQKAGALVPFIRPAELAQDQSPKVPVLVHALKQAERLYHTRFEIIVDLDPTSPLRTTVDLDKCLTIFQQKKPTTLFSVTPARKNPYFNMVEVKKTGRIALIKNRKTGFFTRQSAPTVYDMNASIYFYNRAYLLSKTPRIINPRCAFYVMDETSAVDIDREIDFLYVEFLQKKGLFHL
jgi:CMP-N-acetylneuraminic acid synthetase